MSIVSGTMQAQATKSAGKAQASASRFAASEQVRAAEIAAGVTREGMAQQERLTAPWRIAGKKALGTLERKLAAGPGEFTESPGYKFRLAEGEKAINRMASARGGLLSGGTGKALTRYGQDYATQDYDQFLGRYYDALKPYQSLAGVGQTTSAQQATNVGTGTANLANLAGQSGAATAAGYLGAGQAQASSYLSQGQIFGNSMNQGLQAYSAWKGYQQPAAVGYGAGLSNAGGLGSLTQAQSAGAAF